MVWSAKTVIVLTHLPARAMQTVPKMNGAILTLILPDASPMSLAVAFEMTNASVGNTVTSSQEVAKTDAVTIPIALDNVQGHRSAHAMRCTNALKVLSKERAAPIMPNVLEEQFALHPMPMTSIA